MQGGFRLPYTNELPLTFKGRTEKELVEEKKIIPDALIKLIRHNVRIKNNLEEG